MIRTARAVMSQERFAFLRKVHDRCIELLHGVSFDKRPSRDGYVVCLYASLIELCGGILVLIEKDRKTAVSPVFRTFFEAYVDFKNAGKDPTYIGHAYARHHKDWIKVLTAKPNPFLAGILTHENKDASLKRHQDDIQKLKACGIRPLKVEEKFDKAEMADEFRSIYHFECDAAHNSWQALISRHFEKCGDDFELALYMRGGSLDDYATYLDASAALLLDATDQLHERLKSGKQDCVKGLLSELSDVRATAERMAAEAERLRP